ncbi:MAG: ribonuclease [Lachnospiraceae bacterium]|nr:ribonuclease [Lachnospiraceae bacterium]
MDLILEQPESGSQTVLDDQRQQDEQQGQDIQEQQDEQQAQDIQEQQEQQAQDIQEQQEQQAQDSKEQSGQGQKNSETQKNGQLLETAGGETVTIEENGSYSSKEEVALYIHLYGHLPDNYITKKEAENLGWESREGNLWEVAPGKSIGGSKFGNYEGLLPEKNGRQYYECDIDFDGGYRNEKRIVYSNDGLIYYTDDHYESFERLFGEE